MPLEPTQPSDHFSLWTLASGLASFALPAGPFDPAGTWTNVYGAYSLTPGLRPAGTLTIARAAPGPRLAGLTVTEPLLTATSAIQPHDSVIEATNTPWERVLRFVAPSDGAHVLEFRTLEE